KLSGPSCFIDAQRNDCASRGDPLARRSELSGAVQLTKGRFGMYCAVAKPPKQIPIISWRVPSAYNERGNHASAKASTTAMINELVPLILIPPPDEKSKTASERSELLVT